MSQIITIVVGTVFQDAGEATRAMEIAQGIVEHQPQGVQAKIVILSRGSRFEERAKNLGFEIFRADPPMNGLGVYHDFKMKSGEFVGDPDIAYELLKGEIEAYKKIQPDLVLHGFWPFGSLARRMMDKEIPGICFMPIPPHENLFEVVPDAPEEIKPLSIFPKKIRKFIIHHIPRPVRRRLPILRHRNIRLAAQRLGWKKPFRNPFAILKADLTLVNDLHEFYEGGHFPETFQFTGPVFSRPLSSDTVDESIRKVFDAGVLKPKVFCSMGSSGNRNQLLEVVKAFSYGVGLEWNGVILSPPSVCPIQESQSALGIREGVVLTDVFIPATLVNAMADVVISHGGQGTLQTAIHSGTPVVGLALQPEQQINLDHIAAFGAGIRIPRREWKSGVIQQRTSEVLGNSRYKTKALALRELLNKNNGKEKSALAIWDFLNQRGMF